MIRGLAALGVVALSGWALFGAVRVTSSDRFCTSCHVMDQVAAEWRESPHYANAAGVVAGCADCHVPPGALPTLRSKIRSLHGELLPWLLGVDTPEELEPRRLELAEKVWSELRETDSASCRSCHRMGPEALALQERRAQVQHRDAEREGQTCIECHDDGIAHKSVKPEEPEAGEEEEWDDFTL